MISTYVLAALRFFRHCLGAMGDVYSNRMMKSHSFGAIVEILIESSARNSLLNSAVLELLQFILKVSSFQRLLIFRKAERQS